MSSAWAVERVSGTAELPSADVPDAPTRTIRIAAVDTRLLVLGSAQSDADVDAGACQREGVRVVRRRSGGGAVLVEPGAVAWVDVVIPTNDELWSNDVGHSFEWLGDAWMAALTAVGVDGASVHRGPMVRSRWSSRVCFAGLGPGEVSVGGKKVVGLAQRRARGGALFQCALLLRWEPSRLVPLLAMPSDSAGELSAFATSASVSAGDATDALVETLTSTR